VLVVVVLIRVAGAGLGATDARRARSQFDGPSVVLDQHIHANDQDCHVVLGQATASSAVHRRQLGVAKKVRAAFQALVNANVGANGAPSAKILASLTDPLLRTRYLEVLAKGSTIYVPNDGTVIVCRQHASKAT